MITPTTDYESNHAVLHANDFDPSCRECAAEIDWCADALKHVEGGEPTFAIGRPHLVALIARIEEREATILVLRRLLEQTVMPLKSLESIALGNLSLEQIETDVNGVNDGKQRAIYLRAFIQDARQTLGDNRAALRNQITNSLATSWPEFKESR